MIFNIGNFFIWANNPLCMIMWSINLVTATVHEVTVKRVKNVLLTDTKYFTEHEHELVFILAIL